MALKSKTRAQGMPSQGGRYTNAQLQALWIRNGGSPNKAGMAAAIALAESGGDTNATDYDSNGTVDKGLWQINSVHGAMSSYNPDANAQAAVSISQNGNDWSAWTTFQTGAYQQYLDGSSAVSTGTTGGGSSQSASDGTGSSASSTPAGMSLSDLLTSPSGIVGDFAALVLLGVVKGVADGVADYIIRPAWNFNLRAVNYYTYDILFDNERQPWPILTAAAFWGFGYALLWTDPDSNSLKPTSVRKTRLGRHARAVQSIPARGSLVKPKHVQERTPDKPTPVKSQAHIRTTGTMNTSRSTPVRISGTHANAGRTDDNSRIRIDGEGTIPEPHRSEETRQTEKDPVAQPAGGAGVSTSGGRQHDPRISTRQGRRGRDHS